MNRQRKKAAKGQPKFKITKMVENISDWIKWNTSPIVILSLTALVISIVSAILTTGTLIQYLITH